MLQSQFSNIFSVILYHTNLFCIQRSGASSCLSCCVFLMAMWFFICSTNIRNKRAIQLRNLFRKKNLRCNQVKNCTMLCCTLFSHGPPLLTGPGRAEQGNRGPNVDCLADHLLPVRSLTTSFFFSEWSLFFFKKNFFKTIHRLLRNLVSYDPSMTSHAQKEG